MINKPTPLVPKTKWLVLSHCFNMDGRAASQVIANKIPFLIQRGIHPIVISAPMGTRATTHKHIQAFAIGPSALRFDARHLISERIGKGLIYKLLTVTLSITLAPLIIIERLIFGLQNHASWVFSATFFGLITINKYKPNIIYSSGGAYNAHWAAYWLHRLTGVPWIAEIHDSMILSDEVLNNRNTRRIAKIEGLICTHANLVWWLTKGAFDSARLRHPKIGQRGFWVHCGASKPLALSTSIIQKSTHFHAAHFGSLSKTRSMAILVEALTILFDTTPGSRKKIVIDLFGSDLDAAARKIAFDNNLEDCFVFHGRLHHQAIFDEMVKSDLLLLVHGTSAACSEYIPAKTFEYFWANRPILACVFNNSELADLILERNGYVASGENSKQIADALLRAYLDWEHDSWKPSEMPPVSVESSVNKILNRISLSIPNALP